MNSSRLGRIFSVAVLVSLLAACGPGTSSTSSKTLHVIGTWGGSEQASFLAMVKPWEDRTGNKVSYEGSRDINALLTTRVKAGNPPDLAGLPGPGQMAQFAKAGSLFSLDNAVDTAVADILDHTTFAELARRWKESQTKYVPNWEI